MNENRVQNDTCQLNFVEEELEIVYDIYLNIFSEEVKKDV